MAFEVGQKVAVYTRHGVFLDVHEVKGINIATLDTISGEGHHYSWTHKGVGVDSDIEFWRIEPATGTQIIAEQLKSTDWYSVDGDKIRRVAEALEGNR